MRDRISTQVLENGAIRYAVYDAEGNFLRYEYMLRADEPIQDGTPLNKANLLTDETAEKIWKYETVPADPTVDNALSKLSQRYKVGDVFVTARNDMGEDWLLCNGDTVPREEYPELSSLFSSTHFQVKDMLTAVPGETRPQMQVTEITKLNNYYIILGYSINGYVPIILYAEDPNGPWTVKQLVSNNLTARHIKYINGMYIAVGGTSDGVSLCYATELGGEWTYIKLTNSNGYFGTYSTIAYGNGYYVVNADSTNSSGDKIGGYFYATDINGPWSLKKDNLYYVCYGALTFDEALNKFLMISTYTRTNYTTLESIKAYDTPNMTGAITLYTHTTNTKEFFKYSNIEKVNGYYILYGLQASGGLESVGLGILSIYKTTNGTPVGKYVSLNPNGSTLVGSVNAVNNFIAIASGNKVIVYDTSTWGDKPTSTIVESSRNSTLIFAEDTKKEKMYLDMVENGGIEIVATTASQQTDDTGIYKAIISNCFQLPTISLDSVYSYIKAKE